MTLNVVQGYIEAGSRFPFSYLFQHKISKELTNLTNYSEKFSEKYADDYDFIFFMSAKSALHESEIRGPDIDDERKNVEYGISVPFSKYETQGPRQYKWALQHLFKGIYEILERYGIHTDKLRCEEDRIIAEILGDPKMFKTKR